MPVELKIIVKGNDRKYVKKTLEYDQIIMDPNNLFLKSMIEEVIKEFPIVDTIEEVKVTAMMIVK